LAAAGLVAVLCGCQSRTTTASAVFDSDDYAARRRIQSLQLRPPEIGPAEWSKQETYPEEAAQTVRKLGQGPYGILTEADLFFPKGSDGWKLLDRLAREQRKQMGLGELGDGR